MNGKPSRRKLLSGIGTAAGIAVAGCLGDEGEFPNDPITMVVPFGEGGGVDRSTRELQEALEDELGVNLRFEYHPGAGTQIGQQAALEEDDAYTIGVASLPAFNFTMITGDAPYDLDDFAWVGNLLQDPGLIRVHEDDDRFDDINDLIDYAVDNPGELSVSTSGPYNQNVLGLAHLEEITGAEFNVVPYDGGGDARNALVSQEVDFVHANVFNSLGTAEDTRVLAVHAEENEWADITDDAPTFSDALGFDQEELRPNWPEVRYSWYISQDAADAHPDRLEFLQDAFETAVNSETYEETLADLSPPQETKRDYMSPEETEEANREKHETMEQFVDLMGEMTE